MNLFTKVYTRVSRYGLKYVMLIILRNKVYRPLNALVLRVEKRLFRNHPLTDTIVLESHNDFDTNGGAFYRYLIEHGYNQNYRIVWLLRNKKPASLPPNVEGYNLFRPGLRKNYYICTAKYLSSDHVITEKVRPDQKCFYLTHGPFGLKGFKGLVPLPAQLDYCLCPSKELAPLLAEQYQLPYPNSVQVILGYPEHDVFYQPPQGELKKLTDRQYAKVILWMPTFRVSVGFQRQDSRRELPLGIPIIDGFESYERLNQSLQAENVLLILKIHPMQDLTYVRIRTLSNIIVLDRDLVKRLDIDNYRLMHETDALISDYSSVAYDYLHTGNPIAYTMDDVDDYKLGLIVDHPQDYMAGEIVYTQDDLFRFIDHVIAGQDDYKEQRAALFDRIFQYHDGNSAQRLAAFMGLRAPSEAAPTQQEH